MIPEAVLCYPTTSVVEEEVVDEGGYSADHHPSKLYDDVLEASFGGGATGSAPQLRFLLFSLSSLKQKVDQVESLLVSSIIFTTSQECPNMPVPTHTAVPFATVGTLVQEIVVTASSMMFNCQQMNLLGSPPQTGNNNNNTIYNNPNNNNDNIMESNDINNNNEGSYYSTWYEDDERRTCSKNRTAMTSTKNGAWKRRGGGKKAALTAETYDLVEPEAEDLVAKYTHYCKICGKGFKRDANLRMHMRAHGDEYKSSTALSNPLKKEEAVPQEASNHPRKYSCPQVGCRWNKNHVRFQPLKSIICVKNHYKRSHCLKMYMCKRCNKKQFSVLSDLRTHEKHCGDREWQCSCGTTFSRKDKLMGHVALFIGHTPLVNSLASW